jgi:hypothetical protein
MNMNKLKTIDVGYLNGSGIIGFKPSFDYGH